MTEGAVRAANAESPKKRTEVMALLKPETLRSSLVWPSSKTKSLLVPSTALLEANPPACVLETVTVLPAKTLAGLPEAMLSAWSGAARKSVPSAAPRIAKVALEFVIFFSFRGYVVTCTGQHCFFR